MLLSVEMEGAATKRGEPLRDRLAILLITMLALVTRLACLGGKSLWVDEADSLYFASYAFPDILFRLCDPHPPAYYVLLRVFLKLGQSEFWVRLPSAIAGALTVPLLALFGWELSATLEVPGLTRRTGVLASLFLAVAPLHVWYSQEARMYAMVTALGLCSVYFALRFAHRRECWCAVGYVVTASMALYTDQTSALPLLLANLLWSGLWLHRRQPWDRRGRRQLAVWAGLQLVVGAAFWLWWSRALYSSVFGTGTLYQVAMLMLVLRRLGIAVSADQIMWIFVVGAALLVMGGLWGCWLAARRRWIGGGRAEAEARSTIPPAADVADADAQTVGSSRSIRSTPTASVTVRGKLTSSLAWIVIIFFVLGTVGSAVPRLFTLKRLLVSLLPYGLLVSAWAMRVLRLKRWMLVILILFSLALSVVNIALWPKEPWREVVAVVEREIGPDDQLWVDELAVPVFDYYYHGSRERSVLRVAHMREFHEALSSVRRGSLPAGRIWVVTKVDPYRNLLDYFSPVLLENVVWSADWYHVSVRAYVPPSPGSAPLVPDAAPPTWMLAWPSPVHEACDWGD